MNGTLSQIIASPIYSFLNGIFNGKILPIIVLRLILNMLLW